MRISQRFALSLTSLLAVTPAFSQLELRWDLKLRVSSVSGVSLGDLDGDGDLDACLNNSSAPGSILINDGAGMFTLSETHAALPSGGASAFGDVDGDGDTDLVVSAFFDPCRLYLNDGLGNLSDSGQDIGASAIRGQIILADLNGDTAPDLVLPSDDSSKTNEVWLNDGSGNFTDTTQNLGERFTICAAVGDLNGDTFPDLIMGNNGLNTVWFNDGAGTFTQGADMPLSGTTFGIALADLDGDTDLDAFVANGNISGSLNRVMINDGNGVFTNLAQPDFTSDFHTAVTLEDFDGDLDLDALVCRNRGQTNQIWENNGSGVFSLSAAPAGPGGSFGVAKGDLDGDTDIDIFLPTDTTPVRVMFRAPLAQGGPLIPSPQAISGSQATSAAQADLDGDGDLDVALANIAGTVTLLENDGSGGFTDPGEIYPIPEGNNADSIQVGDVDGVNGPDLVVYATAYSGAADGRDRILLNDGSGRFTESPQVLDNRENGGLRLADVDGDTDLDIVTVNSTGFNFDGQNSIYLNDGSGSFTRVDAFGTGNQSRFLLFDVDGDLDLDAYLAGSNEDDKLWINDGSGGFTVSPQTVGTGSPNALVSADFNGDMIPDLFCANRNGGNRLWINNPAGTLTDSGVNIAPNSATAVAAVDYDEDGDLDLWLGYGGINPSEDRIMLNDGSGTFSFGPMLADVPTREILVADFTGDGSDDVFIASGEGTHQLWAADPSPVALWAAGFGLSGDDTLALADPDGDSLLNFEEMAFNLNPNSADAAPLAEGGSAGLPTISIEIDGSDDRIFRAVSAVRKSAPFLRYRLKTSGALGGFAEPAGVVTSPPTAINADYDRVIFTYEAPAGQARQFGVFEVTYEP